VKLSIIIPVYKVEQYIGRCAESVLNQTYRQLEVILVDDCSSDQSIQIAKDLIEDSEKSGDLVFKYLTHEHFQELKCKQIYPGYLLINRMVGDKLLDCLIPHIEGILMTAVDVCWIAPQESWYNIKYLMYMLASA
jgi:glycosyltransferase involved in cell wall biosynthesis